MVMVMDLSFIGNPAFLSVIIAFLALIFSQLPPLLNLVKGQKIQILIPSYCILYHHLGRLRIEIFLSIQNIGGKSVTISKIEGILKSKDLMRIPAMSYYPSQSNLQELLIGWISLKPKEQWAETTRFFNMFSEEEEDFMFKARDYIESQSGQQTDQVELNENTVIKAKKICKDNFKLKPGDYKFFLITTTDSGKSFVSGCKFSLSKNCIHKLKNTDDYIYGYGIVYPCNNLCYPRIELMNEKIALKQYEWIKNTMEIS